MRTADMFTISNQYNKDACYWVFKTSDDDYVWALGDRLGWIAPGSAVRIDVPPGKVKLGFREGKTPLSGWYAKPKEVETNTGVVLTAKGEIAQPEEAFPNPGSTTEVNFLDEFLIKQNDYTRSLVLAGLGKIPTVGGGIAMVVGFIWPEKKTTMETQINLSEARMKAWVHGRIAQYDRSFLVNTLGGLRVNLDEYIRATGQSQRREWFITCLSKLNDAQQHFVKKDYTLGIYQWGDGRAVGNPEGGEAHTIEVPSGAFIDRVDTQWDWMLSGISFHFTNGTSTPMLGNRTGMGRHRQVASYPAHRLSAVRYNGYGKDISALWFGFTPLPNYYEVKA